MEIIKLQINASGFTDVTDSVTEVLTRWVHDGQISGDALCCVAVATAGAGVFVNDVNPSTVMFTTTARLSGDGALNLTQDHSWLRPLITRASETFLVHGATIQGGRRIYVLSYRALHSCDVAISML